MTKIFYQVNAVSLFGNHYSTSPLFTSLDEAISYSTGLPWYTTKYIVRVHKWVKE